MLDLAIEILAHYKNSMGAMSKPMVVFDIDGTLLREADQTPIVPIVAFYREVQNMGISVSIVTNRVGTARVIKNTKRQLAEAGLSGYKSLFFRADRRCNPFVFKYTARRRISENYTVLMSVGDMLWDIGEYGGYGVLVSDKCSELEVTIVPPHINSKCEHKSPMHSSGVIPLSCKIRNVSNVRSFSVASP